MIRNDLLCKYFTIKKLFDPWYEIYYSVKKKLSYMTKMDKFSAIKMFELKYPSITRERLMKLSKNYAYLINELKDDPQLNSLTIKRFDNV